MLQNKPRSTNTAAFLDAVSQFVFHILGVQVPSTDSRFLEL